MFITDDNSAGFDSSTLSNIKLNNPSLTEDEVPSPENLDEQILDSLEILEFYDYCKKSEGTNICFTSISEILLKNKVFKFSSGLPNSIRHHFWLRLLNAEKITTSETQFYEFLANPNFDLYNQEVIRSDVTRTRAYIKNFQQPESKKELEFLLTFYCKENKIDYKQGLNELLALFFSLKSDEVDLITIYRLFSAFISKFLPTMFYSDQFLRLECSIILFKHLLFYHCPTIAVYLDSLGIDPTLYLIPWLLTIFASKNSLYLTLCFWDFYIALGSDKFFFYIALALIILNSDLILKTEISQIPSLITSFNFTSINQLLKIWDFAIQLKDQTPSSFALQLPGLESSLKSQNDLLQELRTRECMHLQPDEIIRSIYTTNQDDTSSTIPSHISLLLFDTRSSFEFYSGSLPQSVPYRDESCDDLHSALAQMNHNERFLYQDIQITNGSHTIPIPELDLDMKKVPKSLKSEPIDPLILDKKEKKKNALFDILQESELFTKFFPTSYPEINIFPYLSHSISLESLFLKNTILNELLHHKPWFKTKPITSSLFHICFVSFTNDDKTKQEIISNLIFKKKQRWVSFIEGGFKACHDLVLQASLNLIHHHESYCIACSTMTKREAIFHDIPNNNTIRRPEKNCLNPSFIDLCTNFTKIKNPLAFRISSNVFSRAFQLLQHPQVTDKQSSNNLPSIVHLPTDYLSDVATSVSVFGYFSWNVFNEISQLDGVISFDCFLSRLILPYPSNLDTLINTQQDQSSLSKYVSSNQLGLQFLNGYLFSHCDLCTNIQENSSLRKSDGEYTKSSFFTTKLCTSFDEKTEIKMYIKKLDFTPSKLILLPKHILVTTSPKHFSSEEFNNLKSYYFLDLQSLTLQTSFNTIVSNDISNNFSNTKSTKPKFPDEKDEIALVLGVFSFDHLFYISRKTTSPWQMSFFFKSSQPIENSAEKLNDPWITVGFSTSFDSNLCKQHASDHKSKNAISVSKHT